MDFSYPYEKLGLLYLGREIDIESGTSSQRPLLYPNNNLTTHGVIIGMTGSGKTGLGISLIEEAIMDNIPSIIIDPKGDMGNLLLTFDTCSAEEFAPWIDPSEAAKKELTVEQCAVKTAETWKNGLATWGQGTDRIAALRSKTEMTIYTPGSNAGVPVSVLSSFLAPDPEVVNDTDTLNGLVNSTSTSLLALVDIKGDPLQSREHILLSSLFLHYWRMGQDLTMEILIGNIVNPPFAKVGVFALDTFYPQSQRMTLAMSLNNILASPTFSTWMIGKPLDMQRILYTKQGTPRTAIFSIAHLSEAERMFFVTMLLNQFIGWMRRQQGASSLKALLYMDEIFGYFPPIANPPSKKPMMLLLKQARAYGIGVVLATQNPVDLDYKGLSNIGSWFVGRLQTRQDQDRVAEGIAGASDGKLNITKVKKLLSDMKGRRFLLNSVYFDEPLLFETRWVMSYLKGPMSIGDIKKLMAAKKKEHAVPPVGTQQPVFSNQPEIKDGAGQQPIVPQTIEQLYYLQNVLSEDIRFEPWLGAMASVRFFNAKRNIDIVRNFNLRLYLDQSWTRPDWQAAEICPYSPADCKRRPPAGSLYYSLPTCFSQIGDLRGLSRTFTDFLYQSKKLELFRVKGSDFESYPDENMRDFKVRFNDYLRLQKDQAVIKLKEKYQKEQDRLEQQLNKVFDRLEKEKVDVKTKTTDSLISFGVAVIGAFFGRKTFSAANIGKAATGMRSVGRVAKERSDVKRVEQDVEELQTALQELSVEIEQRITELADNFTADKYEIETFTIKPRRSDIFDVRVVLLWEMAA